MKRLKTGSLGLVLVGALASTVLADGRVTITDATNAYNGTNGTGGAFTVTRATPQGNGDNNGLYGDNLVMGDGRGAGADSFLTFCIEQTEHLNFGSSYFTQISRSAVHGGAGGGDPDFISPTTALLYLEFRAMVSDASTTTVSTGGRFNNILGATLSSADTTAIQQAIWYSEDEIGSISGDALSIYNWATANNDGSIHNVRVLRLWGSWSSQDGYSGPHQDLLTIVPLPPAAWAGLASLAGIAGLGYVRRRSLRS